MRPKSATGPMETLSPEAALATIDRAVRVESGLRRRTEGLTWMLWGIVSGATFLTYDAAGAWFGPEGTEWPSWAGFAWLGWLLVGGLFTYVLWRTAAVAEPMPTRRPGGLVAVVAWVAAGFVGFALVFWGFPGKLAPDMTFLVGIGLAWTLLGAVNVHNATPTGRVVCVVVGIVIALLGVVSSFAMGPAPGWHDAAAADAWHARGEMTRAAVGLLVPLVGGAWQALRG